jgi:hypothetical protein
MSHDAHEAGSVEPSGRPNEPSPVVDAERYEVRYSPSYLAQQHGEPDPVALPVAMTVLGVVGGILVLAAIAIEVVGLAIGAGPWGAAPAFFATVILGVLFIIASLIGRTRFPKRAVSTIIQTMPHHAFAITPTAIEFPETEYQPAMSWDRDSTACSVAGDDWTRRLVLSSPGHRTRYYFAWVLTDTPEDLVDRLTAHTQLGDKDPS